MSDRDPTTDLLVVGSGAAGMTAALVARREGLESLVLEKSGFYGGSSAISGGGLWVPDNPLMARAGLRDSPDKAREYLEATVGDRVPAARKEAFLEHAPQMVRYLLLHSHLRLAVMPEYPDYYPERPGGTTGGRGLDPGVFPGRKLGPLLDQMWPFPYGFPLGFACTTGELKKLLLFRRSFRSLLVATKVLLRNAWNLASGAKHRAMGQALIAPLRLSLHELGVPVWLDTPVRQLLVEGDRVVGVEAEREGSALRVRATRGVVLACGGFARNRDMRERYQRKPIGTEWTVASPGDEGDGIRMGLDLGAGTDLMEEAWWGPSSLPPDEPPFFHICERSCPGSILVDSAGRRFTNESAPYIDVVHAMYAHHRSEAASIPAFFITDQRFRSRYAFGLVLPGQAIPKRHLESGYVTRGDTLEELAGKVGIDPQGLSETVRRFNEQARRGRDPEFHRGESAYDRYYGDPRVKPNPCLGPIDEPPYHAVRMVPGDLGTKGGLVTDEHARVLREDETVIEGLYAIGNTSASVMGDTYPGPGSTLAPAMTFGYLAAMHASLRT